MPGAEENQEEVKLNKWDSNAVKNALEDVIRKCMSSKFGYEERHHLMDGRLAISTVAVLFALGALVWDWMHPFPKSRPVLIMCVISYFALMGILQLYTWIVERGAFYVGADVDPTGTSPDRMWYFATKLKRFDHMFTLEVEMKQGDECSQAKLDKSVACWIDEEGHIAQDKVSHDVVKLHDSLMPSKKKQ